MSNIKVVSSANQPPINMPTWIFNGQFSLEEIGLFPNILDISATKKQFSKADLLPFIRKNDYAALDSAWIRLIEKGVLQVHPSKLGKPFYTVNHNWGEEIA
jgi:hypothetical protein